MCLPKVMESWTVSSKIVHLLQCGWISLLSLEHSSIFSLEVIGQVTSKVANLFTVAKVSFHCCHSCLSIHCCQSCLSLLPVVYRFTVAELFTFSQHVLGKSCLSLHCELHKLSICSLHVNDWQRLSIFSLHCMRLAKVVIVYNWQHLLIACDRQQLCQYSHCMRLANVFNLLTACDWQRLSNYSLHVTGKCL